jgi:mannose-1-phosphate guanylyltransferase
MFSERPEGFIGTAMTFDTDDPKSCGIIEGGCDNIFIALHQKVAFPPSCLANAAVFLLDKSFYNYIDEKKDFDFCADVMPKLKGKLNLYKNDIYHRDIGTPLSLKIANRDYLKLIQKKGV